MTKLGRPLQTIFCFVVLSWIAVSSAEAAAQQPATGCDPALTAGPAGTVPCPDTTQAQPKANVGVPQNEASAAPQEIHYLPNLSGHDPLLLSPSIKLHVLYGLRATEGWDSSAAGLSNWHSEFGIYQANFGIASQGKKNFFLFQHSSMLTRYGDQQLPTQNFHITSLWTAGDFTSKWGWEIEGHDAFGQDSLRLIAPLASSVVGGTSVASPNAAVFGINAGRLLAPQGSAALVFHPNQTNSFRLTVRDSYQEIYTDQTHNNISGGRVEYQKQLSNRSSMGMYGGALRETGETPCSAAGGGLQFSTRPTEQSLVQLAAGPEFLERRCGRQQQFTLHFTAAGVLTSRLHGYVSANREFSSGYVSTGSWEDNVTAGMVRKLGQKASWSFDGGYVHATGLGSGPNYSGYVGSTELGRRLSTNFTIVAEYRYFNHTVSSVGVGRHFVLLSLVWNPGLLNSPRNLRSAKAAPRETPEGGNENQQ